MNLAFGIFADIVEGEMFWITAIEVGAGINYALHIPSILESDEENTD